MGFTLSIKGIIRENHIQILTRQSYYNRDPMLDLPSATNYTPKNTKVRPKPLLFFLVARC